ncbi:MAG: hypothetical protein HRF50_00440 [Phycisphaerae bacterium]
MRNVFRAWLGPAAPALLAIAACTSSDLPADLGVTIEQVDRIRNDANLKPQEKRDALAALGIDPVTINGLLAAERLGNQFGGDLESAYRKVVEERMNEMTPDEVQLYGDATAVTQYSDAEAQAISNLFAEQSIVSQRGLAEFLDDPAGELPGTIDRNNLQATFIDFDTNSVLEDLP